MYQRGSSFPGLRWEEDELLNCLIIYPIIFSYPSFMENTFLGLIIITTTIILGVFQTHKDQPLSSESSLCISKAQRGSFYRVRHRQRAAFCKSSIEWSFEWLPVVVDLQSVAKDRMQVPLWGYLIWRRRINHHDFINWRRINLSPPGKAQVLV